MGETDSFLEELCKPDERILNELRRADKQLRILSYGSADQINAARIHIMNAITLTIAQEYKTKENRIEYRIGPSNSIRRKQQEIISAEAIKALKEYEEVSEEMPVNALPRPEDLGKRHHDSKERAQNARSLMEQIRALDKIREGEIRKADMLLDKARHSEPTHSNLCMYCSFLEAAGKLDRNYSIKASNYWNVLTTELVFNNPPKMDFAEHRFSTNETARFEHLTPENKLIHLKRSSSKEDIDKEFRIANFLYALLGDKGIVPQPLKCMKAGEHFYLAQKIFPGRTLDEVLGVKEENDQKLLRMLANKLEMYQRRVAEERRISNKYGFDLKSINYESEFERTFIKRLCAGIDEKSKSRISENMGEIYIIFKGQPFRGVHGDLHAGNVMIHGMDRVCIIDSEKLALGAGMLDWANLIIHTKIEKGIDLEKQVKKNFEMFSPGISTSEQYLIYHCAKVFKSSHMAGTVYKHRGRQGSKAIIAYIDEASRSLQVLKQIIPEKNMPKVKKLIDDYAKIRRVHSL